MIALGPQFRISNVARDRPAIGTIALAKQLHVLHDIVKRPSILRCNAIFDFDDERPAASGQSKSHLGIGQQLSLLLTSRADAGHGEPTANEGEASIRAAATKSAVWTPAASVR